MKQLIVFSLFLSFYSFSQGNDFNLNDYKAYKMTINNLSSNEQALYLARQTEKNLISEFSWVDYTTGVGYFIVKKDKSISDIEQLVSKTYNLKITDSKEIILDDNFFLEMYLQKGGIKKECSLNQPPNYIYLGLGNDNKAEMLYQKAKEIWVKKYPEYYNAFYNTNSEKKEINQDMPEHFPVLINTGNPESDNLMNAKAKQEWLKNYPDEVEQYRKLSLSK